MKEGNNQKIIESLSPNERKIIPFLNEKTLDKINDKTGLGKVAILRALEFLSNKNAVKLNQKQEKVIELGINGLIYKKQGLPERRLINFISEKKSVSLQDAIKYCGLNENDSKPHSVH
jgi:phenylalanyl-tRNA synthetase alpha chain